MRVGEPRWGNVLVMSMWTDRVFFFVIAIRDNARVAFFFIPSELFMFQPVKLTMESCSDELSGLPVSLTFMSGWTTWLDRVLQGALHGPLNVISAMSSGAKHSQKHSRNTRTNPSAKGFWLVTNLERTLMMPGGYFFYVLIRCLLKALLKRHIVRRSLVGRFHIRKASLSCSILVRCFFETESELF